MRQETLKRLCHEPGKKLDLGSVQGVTIRITTWVLQCLGVKGLAFRGKGLGRLGSENIGFSGKRPTSWTDFGEYVPFSLAG